MAVSIKGTGKRHARARRHLRVRKRVHGTAERPRLVVNRSSRHMFAQLVDDTTGTTLVSASTLEADLRALEGAKTEKARKVGELIAERAKAKASEPTCLIAAVTRITCAEQPRWADDMVAVSHWSSHF